MAELDLVIVGAGAVGAAAARRAGEAGARTLVLELAVPAHDKGSSHGPGRIFRHAYFEHPDYVPLLRHATARFEQLADEEGVELLHRCGVLLMGREDSEVVTRSIDAAAAWNVDIETLDGWSLARRFPVVPTSPRGATSAAFSSATRASSARKKRSPPHSRRRPGAAW
jgi:glycine/D-amino acid oxidase-like deaminating enzyme